MECLTRSLHSLANNPDFNYHPKCERMGIISICFADDILLFARGDHKSVDLLHTKFQEFSRSTGLNINKSKCFLFSGGMGDSEIADIKSMTGFSTGILPFRYLGIPLDCKKLSIRNCLPLIDKITDKLRHWSSHFLSYAGRLQLIKSILFGISNYWLSVFPLPRKILNHVEGLCRSFLWSGKDKICRKAPVAWDKCCKPKNAGGLNLTDLGIWKTVCCLKNLWNLINKADRLWIKWVHIYYFKKLDVMEFKPTNSCSWTLRHIMKCRSLAESLNLSSLDAPRGKFPSKEMYRMLQGPRTQVPWRRLFYDNLARPRAIFVTWMLCNDALSTKDKLQKIGINVDSSCSFCTKEESAGHLFFECCFTKQIWIQVLRWLKISHTPTEWKAELRWITDQSKGNPPSKDVEEPSSRVHLSPMGCQK